MLFFLLFLRKKSVLIKF